MTVPAVVVTLESNFELMMLPDSARSSPRIGRTDSSASIPWVCALGTLNTTRDEQLPASAVTWRFLMRV